MGKIKSLNGYQKGILIFMIAMVLILWIGLAAFPIVSLLLHLFRYDKKYASISICLMIVFYMIGVMTCGGNPINILIS